MRQKHDKTRDEVLEQAITQGFNQMRLIQKPKDSHMTQVNLHADTA